MSSTYLHYFEEELSYLKEKSEYFSKKHPNVANALGINKDGIEDPEISRLVESVCLLNARIQQKLDDDYSNFTESLFDITYPEYLRTIPSYSILQVDVSPVANAKSFIPKGTMFDLSDDNNMHCFFRTTQDLQVYPIMLTNVQTYTVPFDEINYIEDLPASNMIEFAFVATDSSLSFSSLELDKFNLYIKNDANSVFRIYDEIRHNLLDVYVELNGVNYRLGADSISNPAFSMESPVVPYCSNSFTGLNLLNEFFIYQDVFNTIDIDLSKVKDKLNVISLKLKFYLKESKTEVLRSLQKENFCLYTTPIVNLHQTLSEPIAVDFLRDSYPIVIENSSGKLSLYSVDKVTDVYNSTTSVIPKLYDEHFRSEDNTKRWTVNLDTEDGYVNGKLMIIDTAHNIAMEGSHNIVSEVTVTDGYRAASLNTSRISIAPMKSLHIPGDLKLLRRASIPLNPRDSKFINWNVLSHMKFNYQSVFVDDDYISGLKQIFKMYNLNQSRQNQLFIDAIKNVESQQTVEPIRIHGQCCYICGNKTTITLSNQDLKDGIYIFAEFLDKFLSNYVNFNSFIQLNVILEGSDEVYISFPRRMGCKEVM